MKKIIVADDDKIKRLKNVRLLRSSGYEVDEAKNGVEAVNLLAKTQYDLLVIDNIMPKLTGIDTCKYLKENKIAPQLKIVLFIGFGNLADYPEINEIGIQKAFVKPINQSDLLSVTEQLIGK